MNRSGGELIETIDECVVEPYEAWRENMILRAIRTDRIDPCNECPWWFMVHDMANHAAFLELMVAELSLCCPDDKRAFYESITKEINIGNIDFIQLFDSTWRRVE